MRAYTDYEIFKSEQEVASIEWQLQNARDHLDCLSDIGNEWHKGYYQGQIDFIENLLCEKKGELKSLIDYKGLENVE